MTDKRSSPERLNDGAFRLVRYMAWRRDCAAMPAMACAEATGRYGELQPVGGGYAAAIAPGRWLWLTLGTEMPPMAKEGYVQADLSASVAAYQIARPALAPLLSHHAAAAMDCDLLAPGFRRIGFASWSIEIAILPGNPAILLVPRGHADNFETLARTTLDIVGSPGVQL